MNFLAHAYLTPTAGATRVGNLLGDLFPGRVERLALPPELLAGVRLHRRIDSFIDSHPTAQQSRHRLPKQRRRVSGIIVDMAYDHFLARHWERFHDEPLPRFSQRCYEEAERQRQWLGPSGDRLLSAMRRDDWLASYAHADAVSNAIDRMARRLRRPDLLQGSWHDLRAVYREIEADFFAFMPLAERAVARQAEPI